MTTQPQPTAVTAVRRARIRRTSLIAVEIATSLLLLIIWYTISSASQNPFYPPLRVILQHFQRLWLFSHFQTDLIPSIRNLLAGFGIGAAIGIILGTIFGVSRRIRSVFGPVIDFWRAIPPVALVPIIVSLVGFKADSRITAIALAAIFPTLISTIDGLRALDPQLRQVAAAYRFNRRQLLFQVLLPGASPRIASGLQVSLQVAFVVMIASEMLGSTVGIGAQTLLAQQSFATADMWAGIVLLGIIGYIANLIFNQCRKGIMRWYVRSQQITKMA